MIGILAGMGNRRLDVVRGSHEPATPAPVRCGRPGWQPLEGFLSHPVAPILSCWGWIMRWRDVFGNHDIISRRTREKGCASKTEGFLHKIGAKTANFAGAPRSGWEGDQETGVLRSMLRKCVFMAFECGRAAGVEPGRSAIRSYDERKRKRIPVAVVEWLQVLPSSRLNVGAVWCRRDPGFEASSHCTAERKPLFGGGGRSKALPVTFPCAPPYCLIHLLV